MVATPLEMRIREMIEPSLNAMGYHIVQVRLNDGAKRRVLQIMAERNDGRGMSVDDCAEISHVVSALMDVEDPITGAYQLEVSSPGIDRPLTRKEDFARFSGFEAKLETIMPISGRKRFRGNIQGVEGEDVVLMLDNGEARIRANNIKAAKLVLTPELIQATMKQQAG